MDRATADRWISTFLAAQAAERNAARNTQLAYGRDLGDFAAWLAPRGELATASRAMIADYLIFCEAQGLAKATRARRLAAIRQLYRFAVEEGWRADNPGLRLKGPGASHHLPQTLDIAEVDRLLAAARDKGRATADRQRNRAALELLYATGMRVSELVELPVAAVRGNPQMILVRGKGGRERMVPLSPPARAALADWLHARDAAEAQAVKVGGEKAGGVKAGGVKAGGVKAGGAASKYLFPSRGAGGHLTREYFYLLIKDIAVLAGVDPAKVTPHRLRHAFATHLLAGGADLRVIQTLLGHADIATTEIYTHVLDAHLKALVLDHHPLAGKGAGKA